MESSFQTAICECPDINASTMAIDATGRYVLISGRKSMVLVDLDGESPEPASVPVTVDDPDATAAASSQNPEAALAGVRGPVIQPKIAPVSKRMARNSKYEPTASQFNRFMTDLYALTTYQIVELFSIEELNPLKPKLVIRGHSRAISDIEWSHFDPYLLGSSAADCLTNLWDVRDSRRPSATLTSVSGATQVRFCKTSSNLMATSHEIDVRIWDIRQPNLPLYYIAAHLQKINGMDWNPNKTSCDQEQLITSSQDNTIKLWNLNANKIKPHANLPTRLPAWRVRYTPVSSNAILTSTLPQLRSRTECTALKLWSMKPNRFEQKKLELILGLVGHNDVIVDFDWRHRAPSTNCEIVSWSKDQTLRVWRIDNQFIEMNVDNSDFETECEPAETPCESMETSLLMNEQSENEPSSSQQEVSKSRSRSPSREVINSLCIEAQLKTLSLERSSAEPASSESDQDEMSLENSSSHNQLRQEFNLLNKNIPNIEFEELNSLRRVCLVTARAKNVTCRLRIALPPSYPHNDCPTFTIIDSNQFGGDGLSKEAKEKLLSLLDETARSQLSRNMNCLEPCLRKFIAALQKLASQSSYRRRPIGVDARDDLITLSAQRDHSVPFPTVSRARFCGNMLVCFGRPLLQSVSGASGGGESTNWLVETPRSLAQLSAQLDNMRRQGSYNLSHISISYFYYGAMRRAEVQSRNVKDSNRAGSKYLAGRGKSILQAQTMSKSYKCGPVMIYDVSKLLGGISRDLAENYVFDKDVIRMCRKNAEIAATHNRRDLVQIWSLAELSSEGVLHSYVPSKHDDGLFPLVQHDSDFGDRPWTMHPFGSKLIQSLIDHYMNNCRDVQTAAMLVWTFSSPKLGRSTQAVDRSATAAATAAAARISASSSNQKLGNPQLLGLNSSNNYHTVIPGLTSRSRGTSNVETISDEWSFVNGPETHLYSNSWSNSTIHEHLADSQSTDELVMGSASKLAVAGADDSVSSSGDRFPKLNILSPERSIQNDLIMHIYAELLYRMNLLNQRAMVLKNVGSNSSSYVDIFGSRQTSNEVLEERLSNLSIQCSNILCRHECRSAQCPCCKRYSLYCSICRLPVKGPCSICLKCLHGGHVDHFNSWFKSYDFCPTGCGCRCPSME